MSAHLCAYTAPFAEIVIDGDFISAPGDRSVGTVQITLQTPRAFFGVDHRPDISPSGVFGNQKARFVCGVVRKAVRPPFRYASSQMRFHDLPPAARNASSATLTFPSWRCSGRVSFIPLQTDSIGNLPHTAASTPTIAVLNMGVPDIPEEI
jgi:hypothetical protein